MQDKVEVKETQGDTASVIELRVAVEDLGRIIGKQGRHIRELQDRPLSRCSGPWSESARPEVR